MQSEKRLQEKIIQEVTELVKTQSVRVEVLEEFDGVPLNRNLHHFMGDLFGFPNRAVILNARICRPTITLWR